MPLIGTVIPYSTNLCYKFTELGGWGSRSDDTCRMILLFQEQMILHYLQIPELLVLVYPVDDLSFPWKFQWLIACLFYKSFY